MRFLAFVLSLPLLAGVDGTVLNRTSGKPQAGATVSLFKLGSAGMESLETVKSDASGKFSLQTTPGPGPHLTQVAFDGVIYNKMMPPGSPQTGLQLEVFNSQAKPGDAKVTQHMFLFEAADGRLMVNENIVYENTGKLTFNDPTGGTLRFYLPPETGGKVKVMGTAPNGMPVERAANPASSPNIYGIDFPIRPGETRFQLIYEMPLSEPAVFTGKVLHKEGTTRLVSPKGVTLTGEGLSELGREPATQAAIYNLAKQDFQVTIEGSGSLRDTPASGGGEDEGAGIQEILPRVYTRLPVVLALAFAILLLGFVMLYRGTSPGADTAATPAPSGKGKRRG